ncbi:MAG TPA: Ig domain-containing protein, partial [Planctomycetota bacterium]|nr:Ig domain-containing protein [Planctomycetota bacterium]
MKLLTYSESQMREWRTIAVTPNLATCFNFAPTHFEITPALPAGLNFDQSTGRISGTPQEVLGLTSFEIGAYDGNTFLVKADVSIVVFADVPPSGLSYQPSAVSVLQGGALPSLVPSFTGAAESFSVSPALPAGVAINPQTGTIAGICSGPEGVTQHTVTVSNPIGTAQADVEITVLEAPSLEGLLVASQGDLTLDVFGLRNVGFAPIDAE